MPIILALNTDYIIIKSYKIELLYNNILTCTLTMITDQDDITFITNPNQLNYPTGFLQNIKLSYIHSISRHNENNIIIQKLKYNIKYYCPYWSFIIRRVAGHQVSPQSS